MLRIKYYIWAKNSIGPYSSKEYHKSNEVVFN